MSKPRFASVWLGGCSGCHMSFLDMDEWLFELAEMVDVVYSPVVDIKEFPDDVDLTLVEGALANEENLEMAKEVRAKSKIVASFGDCAVSGNVTAMRNPLGDPEQILKAVYEDAPDKDPVIPRKVVPALLPKVLPVHRVIDIDLFMPGCPPSSDEIKRALQAVLADDRSLRDADDIRPG